MKHILDLMTNGNIADATRELYELPFSDYPKLIEECANNQAFGHWVARRMQELIQDKTIILKPCGDKRNFQSTEQAMGSLNLGQPVAAMMRLQYGAKKRTGRLIRRSVRITGQLLMRNGLAGIDRLISACNTGMDDD